MAVVTSKNTELKLRSIARDVNGLTLSFEKHHYYPSEDHIIKIELNREDTRQFFDLLRGLEKLEEELENGG